MAFKIDLPFMGKVVLMLLCFIPLGSSRGETADNQIKYSGTFSSLEYNEEGGDLLGAEIKIVPTRNGYQGVLQIAEGGPSALMVVIVQFKDGEMSFEIPQSYPEYGGLRFKGKIDKQGIVGEFISSKGKAGDQEKWTRKHSYWDGFGD